MADNYARTCAAVDNRAVGVRKFKVHSEPTPRGATRGADVVAYI